MIKRLLILTLWVILFSGHTALAANLSAKAVVENTDLSLGEPFAFQIQVSGAENPEQPDLSGVRDFTVVFQGGQQNSSRSVTIINGKVTQDVREGYYFSYQLTPSRSGSLTIPSIKIKAGNSSTETEPIQIIAREPSETEDFKFRISLSRGRCYTGEPVILTATWYIGKDVKDFNFTLPVLSDTSFKFADIDATGQQSTNAYRIPLGNGEVAGIKGKGSLDGREFTTVTFKKVLIPVRSGDIAIRPATVSCTALVGYQRQRDDFNNGAFRNFFNDDFFNNSSRGVYNTVVVPSNSLSLKVLDLPEKGRPSDFTGHVGKYTINASAMPAEVSVGDPITLTLTLCGPDYLENVQMPAIEKQAAITRDFKIPAESARGEISGKVKVFTQTLRPLRADVKEIPPIELSYFDTGTQRYEIIATKPIPLVVKEANIITAHDAEGNAGQIVVGSEVETLNKGIASNYEDVTVIQNAGFESLSWITSPLCKGLIIGPPLIYLLLFAGSYLNRHRNGDSKKVNSRKAYGRLLSALKDARNSASTTDGYAMVQEAMRNYLGDKLHISGKAALTFNDIKQKLSDGAMRQEIIDAMEDLFRRCEAGRYAGIEETGDVASLAEKAEMLAKEVEKAGSRRKAQGAR